MRRAFNDAIMSAGALVALLALLVAIDSRVREQVVLRAGGGRASTDVVKAGTQVRDFAAVLLQAITDAFRLHTTLAIFVVIATLLTLFMVRT